MSLGLTAFASLMGDAGAAAGEPLESYRATNESTGVPELSPLGRRVSLHIDDVRETLFQMRGIQMETHVPICRHGL